METGRKGKSQEYRGVTGVDVVRFGVELAPDPVHLAAADRGPGPPPEAAQFGRNKPPKVRRQSARKIAIIQA